MCATHPINFIILFSFWISANICHCQIKCIQIIDIESENDLNYVCNGIIVIKMHIWHWIYIFSIHLSTDFVSMLITNPLRIDHIFFYNTGYLLIGNCFFFYKWKSCLLPSVYIFECARCKNAFYFWVSGSSLNHVNNQISYHH